MYNISDIGIVLVNYHTNTQTIEIANKYAAYEIISRIVIINNDAKSDYYMDEIKNDKISVFNIFENLGYSKGNNIGIEKLIAENCRYIIISNSDVDVSEECIIRCVEYLISDNSIGLIAPRMKFPNGKYAPLRYIPLNYLRILLRVILPEPIVDRFFEHRVQTVNNLAFQSYVPGSFFVINGDVLTDTPFFDPDIFLYREEEILGERVKRRGYKIAIATNIEFIHNHVYHDEPYEKMRKMNKQMMKSERVLFKKYYNANRLQMVYVYFMQNVFSIVRCIFWKVKEIRK